MTRQRVGSTLCLLTAVLLLATAAFHHTGFRYVSRLAGDAAPELRPLVPPLWLAFSASLVVLALIAAIAARRPAPGGRAILLIIALFPAAAAALQVRYLGFIPPTAILLVDAAVAIAAALLLEPRTPHGPGAA